MLWPLNVCGTNLEVALELLQSVGLMGLLGPMAPFPCPALDVT